MPVTGALHVWSQLLGSSLQVGAMQLVPSLWTIKIHLTALSDMRTHGWVHLVLAPWVALWWCVAMALMLLQSRA